MKRIESKKNVVCVFIFMSVWVFTGCATWHIGKKFEQGLELSPLIIGRSSESEILREFGEPVSIEDLSKNGSKIKALNYIYSMAESKSDANCPIKARVFYVFNDVLIGTKYSSTFVNENSTFDWDLAQTIHKGEAKEKIVKLLGVPSGVILPPLSEDNETLVYTRMTSDCNFRLKKREVFFDINKAGKISNVISLSQDQR